MTTARASHEKGDAATADNNSIQSGCNAAAAFDLSTPSRPSQIHQDIAIAAVRTAACAQAARNQDGRANFNVKLDEKNLEKNLESLLNDAQQSGQAVARVELVQDGKTAMRLDLGDGNADAIRRMAAHLRRGGSLRFYCDINHASKLAVQWSDRQPPLARVSLDLHHELCSPFDGMSNVVQRQGETHQLQVGNLVDATKKQCYAVRSLMAFVSQKIQSHYEAFIQAFDNMQGNSMESLQASPVDQYKEKIHEIKQDIQQKEKDVSAHSLSALCDFILKHAEGQQQELHELPVLDGLNSIKTICYGLGIFDFHGALNDKEDMSRMRWLKDYMTSSEANKTNFDIVDCLKKAIHDEANTFGKYWEQHRINPKHMLAWLGEACEGRQHDGGDQQPGEAEVMVATSNQEKPK